MTWAENSVRHYPAPKAPFTCGGKPGFPLCSILQILRVHEVTKGTGQVKNRTKTNRLWIYLVKWTKLSREYFFSLAEKQGSFAHSGECRQKGSKSSSLQKQQRSTAQRREVLSLPHCCLGFRSVCWNSWRSSHFKFVSWMNKSKELNSQKLYSNFLLLYPQQVNFH